MAQAKNNNVAAGEGGFSFVELVITMLVLTIVLGVITGVIVSTQRAYTAQRVRTEMVNDSSAALDTFVRLIRNAGNNSNLIPISADPNNDGLFTDIQLRADWNPQDGDLTDRYENIQFRFNNGRIEKNEPTFDSTTWLPFTENVQSLNFAYFDAAGNQMSTPQTQHANIVSVRVTIVTSNPNSMTFTTFATMRERR